MPSHKYCIKPHIRRDSNTPHRNSRHTTCEDDGTEVQVRRRRPGRCESFLRYFIGREIRSTSRAITSQRSARSSEYAPDTTFTVQAAHNVKNALVLLFASALALNLKQNLRPFDRRSDECLGNRRDEASQRVFGRGELLALSVRCRSVDYFLAKVVSLSESP